VKSRFRTTSSRRSPASPRLKTPEETQSARSRLGVPIIANKS
jgi:hypothetical protein